MAEHRRVAALSAAVAATTAAVNNVEIDHAALFAGLDEAEVIAALTQLASMLTEHAPFTTGPVMLRVIGEVAAWVGAGGE